MYVRILGPPKVGHEATTGYTSIDYETNENIRKIHVKLNCLYMCEGGQTSNNC